MGLSQVQANYSDGKLNVALEDLLDIEKEYEKDHPDFFDLKLLKAQIYLDIGELEKGETLLNSLLDLARRQGNKLLRLDIIIKLTNFLWRKGDWDQTIFMIEMGEYDFTKLGTEIDGIEKIKRYAHLKLLKGIYYRYTGELDLALEYFNESLVEAELTNDKHMIAEIYNLIGLINYELGDLTKAWNYYIKGYQSRQEINDKAGICVSLYNLGSIQEYIGELDAARENYQQALRIAEEIGNRRLKGQCLGGIGVIYQKNGEFNVAFEYLSKSLAIKSDIGNDNETSWTLYRITNLLLNSQRKELAPIFIDGLEDLHKSNPHNRLITQHHNLIKATQLKDSLKTIDRAEAQQIFYDIINDSIIDHELTIYAMLNLCDILLSELQITADPEILDEIEEIFEVLHTIVAEQHSFPLMIEIFALEAKYAMLELDYTRALSLFNQASEMAEQKGISTLLEKISDDYQILLRKVEEINAVTSDEAQLIAQVEQTELEEEVSDMIKERKKQVSLSKEIPILFLITDENDTTLFKKQFENDKPLDNMLIQSFIKAINSIIRESFHSPGPVDRIQHGEYTLLSREIDELSYIYVYKGENSYQALSSLDKVISSFTNNKQLYDGFKNKSFHQNLIENINDLLENIIS